MRFIQNIFQDAYTLLEFALNWNYSSTLFGAFRGLISEGLKTTTFGALTVDLKCVGTSFPDGSGSAKDMLDMADLRKKLFVSISK